VTRLAHLGEIGALGQEPVSRVNGVGARYLGRADHGGHVEIAVSASRGTNAHVLVGELHVELILVRFRVDGDRLDAKLPARINDAQSDFTAVRDQDLLEHGHVLSRPYGEQPLPVLHRLAILDVDVDDLSVVLRVDLVHELHRFDDAQDVALLHRRANLGKGR